MAQTYPATPALPNNRMAFTSLISGLVGWAVWALFLCFNWSIGLFLSALTFGLSGILLGLASFLPTVPWLVGVVTGHMGLGQVGHTGERGKGMAITGLVLGYLGLLMTLCTVGFYVLAALGLVAFSLVPT